MALTQTTGKSHARRIATWTGETTAGNSSIARYAPLNSLVCSSVQISGTIGGATPVTTGYYNTGGLTSGFSLPSLTAVQAGTGIMFLTRASGNTWVMNSGASGTTGWKTFSGAVTGVRLTTSAGTFDAGQAGVAWR